MPRQRTFVNLEFPCLIVWFIEISSNYVVIENLFNLFAAFHIPKKSRISVHFVAFCTEQSLKNHSTFNTYNFQLDRRIPKLYYKSGNLGKIVRIAIRTKPGIVLMEFVLY